MASAPSQRVVFLQAELSASALSALGEADPASLSASYGGRFGFRLPRPVDFFLVVEHNLWLGSDLAHSGIPHVLNWGGGMGAILRHAKVRSSVAVGGSTMLFDTVNGHIGDTGLFVDVRPLALRFRAGARSVVEIVFLSFQASIPKIEGIPLIHLEFRTALTLELGLT
ncbi:MAG: hypothetical protein MUC50_02960 [Myxococcota bacterium]|nr:hypothetical protein [Myxococcota bacterium]